MGAISKALRCWMIGVALAASAGFADGAAAASEQRLTYTVQMSPYGTIGTYQSVKQTNGNETTITTEAHIKVSLAGVVLYRLEISRVERQIADQAGALVVFGWSFERRLDDSARAERRVPLDGVGEVVQLPEVNMVDP